MRGGAAVAAAIAMTALTGCQADKKLALEQPDFSLDALTRDRATRFEKPTVKARSSDEAAIAYLDCALRVYYTAETPISPLKAVNTCYPYMDQFRRLYLSERNISQIWARKSREELTREAVDILEGRIAIYGAREVA